LNIVFFCTIDPNHFHTFFDTRTAQQELHDRFLASELEEFKFGLVVAHRKSYTIKIHREMKEFVADNIVRWKEEKPAWFKIDKIPDDFLPQAVLEAEGGAQRRRPSMFFSEMGFTTRRKKNSAENV